jgi:hypothetical protein
MQGSSFANCRALHSSLLSGDSKKMMENESPVKVHFISNQFVGGVYYILTPFIMPFEPYRTVMEEGRLARRYTVQAL